MKASRLYELLAAVPDDFRVEVFPKELLPPDYLRSTIALLTRLALVDPAGHYIGYIDLGEEKLVLVNSLQCHGEEDHNG